MERDLSDVDEGAAWRRRQRERLIADRLTLSDAAREAAEAAIARALVAHLGLTNPGVVAGYWPHRGEPAVLGAMLRVMDLGGQVALPAVVLPREPMEFRAWGPQSKLIPGWGGVLVPQFGRPLRPDLLLVPMVGFDSKGYRLGYGGGHYDRTVAAMSPRPTLIGVGLERARLKTLHPQPHDIPMDLIVTEEGLQTPGR
ncbi:MAG TPA: 5-formyltetrahydrofolate cyclo-ligase [Caulobacteraceae bacterium]|nr:5-formyltetrahydrofolate cyclo-ligase [Caulobacteraceae bacterium]